MYHPVTLSQAEQRFGAEPSRAPRQDEPSLEPMSGKSNSSGYDQFWWGKFGLIVLPS